MAIECPNCRAPVSWFRAFRTPAWGSWVCRACDSRLGVSLSRRMIAVGICVLAGLGASMALPLAPAWDAPLILGIFFAILAPYFTFFEQPRLIERSGFHCKKCGYDLHGLVELRCPECGTEFDEEQRARSERISGEIEASTRSRRRTRIIGITLVVILFSLTLAGVFGTWLFTARARSNAGVTETAIVLGALQAVGVNQSDQLPHHAIGLVGEGGLSAEDFVTFNSLTMASAVLLGEGSLEQFGAASAERRRAIVDSVVASVPAGIVAHRLGDFVFTYHGIDLDSADPMLWLVIWWPDPKQNPPWQPDSVIPVGLASGRTLQVKALDFASALVAQNALRAKRRLPPLPSPLVVTHTRPAVVNR